MLGEHASTVRATPAVRRSGGSHARPGIAATGRAGLLLRLQSSAGNRAVRSLLAPMVQRCGPNSNCDCPPEEKARAEQEMRSADEPKTADDHDGDKLPVQRDRMAAGGFNQPLNAAEEFAASRRKDAAGNQILNCWEPQSQDFRAAADGPAVGSFSEFISVLKGRGTAKSDVMLIGHGASAEGGVFAFGGPVARRDGPCDDVRLTRETAISVGSVDAKKADLAAAGKALSSLTLASCNSGLNQSMTQKLANALGVTVRSFSDPVTMCLGGTPTNLIRGKVRTGSDVPELAVCADITATRPDRTSTPQKPDGGGAVVRDVAFDPDEQASSVTLHDQPGSLTIRPVQITDLSPAAKAKARNFYASQPQRYTPAFITKMQQALQLEKPTGRIDDATLEAVAEFQDAHPPLKGDGMAGPRTLSRLLTFGLATETDREHYVGLFEDAADKFGPATTVDERLAAAWGAVIPSLTQEQVTPIPEVSKAETGGEGAFRPSIWTAFISPQLLDPVPLTPLKRAQLKETVYHEARHAEQLYNQARMLAGKGKTPAQITPLIGTTSKPDVAQEAKSRPLERGSTEFVVAEQLFDATHGEAGRRHDALEKDVVAKRKVRDAALAAAGGNKLDPAVVKAEADYVKVRDEYAQLADEADAFATGEEAGRTPRDSGEL